MFRINGKVKCNLAKLEQNIYETGEQQVSLETYFKHATQS